MDHNQIILLAILGVMLLCMNLKQTRYDIVALGALFAAAIFGIVPQREVFSGFGNPATITVVLVLMISHAVTHSGAVRFIADVLAPAAKTPWLHIAALTFLAALLSMFMNNVGALALLMPLAIQSCKAAGRPVAAVLMPLSFGSILGGLVTLIGTPPNILVSEYRREVTGMGFAMFDYSPVGGAVAFCGILFMLLFMPLLGRYLVPKRTAADADLLGVNQYLFELKVAEDSAVIGTTIGELRDELAGEDGAGCDLLMLQHKGERLTKVNRRHEIARGDLLVMQGSHEDIDRIAASKGLTMLPADSISREILDSGESQVMEVVITPQSPLIGRTPADMRFRHRYGINLLAVSRAGSPHNYRLREFQFRAGDVLLFQDEADENDLPDAMQRLDCYPLADRQLSLGRGKAMLTLGVCVAAVAATAAGLVAIQLALGIATVVMALTKVVPLRSFYEGVEWPVVVLLGAMIPLGAAMESTGTSAVLVDNVMNYAGDVQPVVILVVILVVTMCVSDVLNNAATAILMLPIAYNIALALGLNPDAFLMAVAVGASCAFLTPIGHQNNALIMGPGGYRFGDYWRVGLPLEVVIVAVAVPMLLYVWPLT